MYRPVYKTKVDVGMHNIVSTSWDCHMQKLYNITCMPSEIADIAQWVGVCGTDVYTAGFIYRISCTTLTSLTVLKGLDMTLSLRHISVSLQSGTA